jgi:adenosylcobinamide-phosphate synthase
MLLALGVDALVGEPPERLHPVVWMGRALEALEARAPQTAAARFAYGSGVALGLPLVCGLLGWSLERLAPWPIQALALEATFAGRGLLQAAERIEQALDSDDLALARQQLRWLVSRPTEQLDRGRVASAAIESLAENLVDSWVGPLLAYAVFGLGGAVAYRAVNTADAMWGYHDPRYEWLGKSVARADDALNWLPARLGAGALVACGPRRAAARGIWRRDARLTASPNAGQAMAAAAGQLDVRLEKPGQYVLNAGARAPTVADIAAARRLITTAMVLTAAMAMLAHELLSATRRLFAPLPLPRRLRR